MSGLLFLQHYMERADREGCLKLPQIRLLGDGLLSLLLLLVLLPVLFLVNPTLSRYPLLLLRLSLLHHLDLESRTQVMVDDHQSTISLLLA